MADETKTETPEQKPAGDGKPAGEQKPEVPAGFDDLRKLTGELRDKLDTTIKANEGLSKEVTELRGVSKVVEGIKQAVSGAPAQPSEEDMRKAGFYKLLVEDPAEAIRQVIQADRQSRDQEEFGRRVEGEFQNFIKIFPEYKEYENQLKAELNSNPAWFSKKNFLQRAFFDVLSEENPQLLAKLLAENRQTPEARGKFLFEGTSQSLNGGDANTGATILERMKSAGPPVKNNFFL